VIRFVLALAVLAASACGNRADTQPIMARMILAVPLGASPQDAIRELDSAGVRHGNYDPKTRTIFAIAKVDSTSIVYNNLQMTLVFSADGRLEKRVFERVLTGP
jgi:hypothetical protein